uniref:Intracellular hyaluronan-binding protein 4 N-terminal domain-containing protein n=1 Tax=Gouania willdenowi TaxID=441366 RepID=A0A8C5E4T7_GOUWI
MFLILFYYFGAVDEPEEMLADTYGCAVTNRFGELLDDEADPFDLISEVETEKEKDKKKKKKKKEDEKKTPQKKPGQKESQRERRVPKSVEVQEPLPGQQNSSKSIKLILYMTFLVYTNSPSVKNR